MPDPNQNIPALLGAATKSGLIMGQLGPHRTAVAVHMSKADWNNDEILDRLTRLATSFNRPDTIKADLYTVQTDNNNNVAAGFGQFFEEGTMPYNQWLQTVGQSQYVLLCEIRLVQHHSVPGWKEVEDDD